MTEHLILPQSPKVYQGSGANPLRSVGAWTIANHTASSRFGPWGFGIRFNSDGGSEGTKDRFTAVLDILENWATVGRARPNY